MTIEWVLIVTACGTSLAAATAIIWALRDAYDDLQKLVRHGIGNGRRLVAYGDVRGGIVRLIIVLLGLAMSLLAIVVVHPPVSTVALAMISVHTATQVLLATNSVADLIVRRRLDAKIRHRNRVANRSGEVVVTGHHVDADPADPHPKER